MESEKVVFVNVGPFTKIKSNQIGDALAAYIPEEGWVIRDIKLRDSYAIIWLQKSKYLN